MKNAFAFSDTTHIYFRLDIRALDEQAKQRIDSLLYMDVINQQQELLIVGYADYLGSNGYNDTLSSDRANNVKAYLQSMGIPGEHITLCVGKGEIPRDMNMPDGYAPDRRVDVVLLEKEVKMPVVTHKEINEKKKEPVFISSREAIKLNTAVDFNPDSLYVGQLFVLDKIFFYTGRHIVVPESQPEMIRLFEMLDENARLEIRIEGHVCCVHPLVDALDMDTGEEKLSVNRAKYIYDYLVKKGIDPKRLTFEGYGKTRPLRPNEFTQEDQDMNKRVEIRIMKL
ncbi:MAG: OmpA family protein [Chitinophagales bacterium]|nr:OmpA family protein [Chitinophagales bacterium]